MTRRVVVCKNQVPLQAVLYRVRRMVDLNLEEHRLAYDYLEQPLRTQQHPLQVFYEDMLMGAEPPPLFVTDQVSTYDVVVAAFIHLYPETLQFPVIQDLVHAVCLMDRWGDSACANTRPVFLRLIQTVNTVLPAPEDVLTEKDMSEILLRAVGVLHGALSREFPDGLSTSLQAVLKNCPEVTDILLDDGCKVAFLGTDTPEILDLVYFAGKTVGLHLCENPSGKITAMFFRRSLLVTAVDFEWLWQRLCSLEANWTYVSPLAIVSPASGTSILPEELIALLSEKHS